MDHVLRVFAEGIDSSTHCIGWNVSCLISFMFFVVGNKPYNLFSVFFPGRSQPSNRGNTTGKRHVNVCCLSL